MTQSVLGAAITGCHDRDANCHRVHAATGRRLLDGVTQGFGGGYLVAGRNEVTWTIIGFFINIVVLPTTAGTPLRECCSAPPGEWRWQRLCAHPNGRRCSFVVLLNKCRKDRHRSGDGDTTLRVLEPNIRCRIGLRLRRRRTATHVIYRTELA